MKRPATGIHFPLFLNIQEEEEENSFIFRRFDSSQKTDTFNLYIFFPAFLFHSDRRDLTRKISLLL